MYLKYALQKLVIVILGIYKESVTNQGRYHYNSEIKRDYFEYNKEEK